MRQINGHDAHFLYSDTAHANSNVTLIQIYDQSTAPGGKVRFKSILGHIESRLDRSPLFRSKLLRVPMELSYPCWVDDENFDIEYHVRHIALPKPGDWRQFCIQASRIHARPLDMNRPLWEIYVVEGLDSFIDLPAGSFALLIKIHHAAVDVEHGSEISMLLHDLTPITPPPQPPKPWFPEAAPGMLKLMLKGALQSITVPLTMSPLVVKALTQVVPVGFNFIRDVFQKPESMTATRFNSVVSPHRVFDTRRFTISDFKAIRGLVPGASLNDAVLAVCAGSLRRYLEAKGELPASSLTALAPVYVGDSQRHLAEGAKHAKRPGVSWIRIEIGSEIADPVSRLRKIRRQTASSAVIASAVKAEGLTEITSHAPAATLALASKLLARAATDFRTRLPLANCTITNVPGSSKPLYLHGARMTYFSAIMPISDGMGLVLTVTSYDGGIVISPTSCRYLMPDPDVFSQCIRDSFQEYLELAQPRAREIAEKVVPRKSKPRVKLAASRGSIADTRTRKRRSARTAPNRLPLAPTDLRRSTKPSG